MLLEALVPINSDAIPHLRWLHKSPQHLILDTYDAHTPFLYLFFFVLRLTNCWQVLGRQTGTGCQVRYNTIGPACV
jgi:hypothetical protein